MDKKLHIKMFGSFKIQFDNSEIGEEINHSRKMWRFFEYVVIFRDKVIAIDEIIDVLWPETDIKNPYNALKNLLYRLRQVLVEHKVPYGKNLILLKNNSIMWNPDIICEVDCELFEHSYKLFFSKELSEEERMQVGKSALLLYTGDFLHKTSHEAWVVSINIYYHTLYIKLVNAILQLLEKRREYRGTISICKQALEIDNLEENFYYYLTKALAEQGKTEVAMKQYNSAKELFYEHLGVELSLKYKSLYKQMTHTKQDVETDISLIQQKLAEEDIEQGGMYCEYEFFKAIYQMKCRAMERDGSKNFISLITITGINKTIEAANEIEQIKQVILKNMRRGDVITRFSFSQYLVLFPCSFEADGIRIMERLKQRYMEKYPKNLMHIEYILERVKINPKE